MKVRSLNLRPRKYAGNATLGSYQAVYDTTCTILHCRTSSELCACALNIKDVTRQQERIIIRSCALLSCFHTYAHAPMPLTARLFNLSL